MSKKFCREHSFKENPKVKVQFVLCLTMRKIWSSKSSLTLLLPNTNQIAQAAHHLLQTSESDSCVAVREKLQQLSSRLKLLLQLCSRLLARMSTLLGQDYTQSFASLASSGVRGGGVWAGVTAISSVNYVFLTVVFLLLCHAMVWILISMPFSLLNRGLGPECCSLLS